jgi:L-alanine-DL-glutamate epimerase-like enolase superfamily enzyme
VKQAIDAEAAWRRFDLTWLEDPFGAEAPAATAALRDEATTPIAAGDEFDPSAVGQLLAHDAVDVLRLDATTLGGVTGFLAACHEAGDREISPHVNIEVHQHLALASTGTRSLEAFPDGRFDAACAFVERGSVNWLASDRVAAPERTGLGIDINWESVEGHAEWTCQIPLIQMVKSQVQDIDRERRRE